MPGWSIEPLASADEIDAVLAVEEASFTNPWTREMYLAEFDNPGVSYLYVARDDARQIVGYCAFWLVHDELHINNLAVAPAVRRAGVATALLTRVLQEGRRLGADRAMLEVRRSNAVALRVYERFGFAVTAVMPDYYSHPVEDALVLWRGPRLDRRP
jgi:ribosomal-protein-alanine N-acetyltransferase